MDTNKGWLDEWHVPQEWEYYLNEGRAILDALVPGWKVGQIKSKFGGCRFYIDVPEDTDEGTWRAAQKVTHLVEDACDRATERQQQQLWRDGNK